MKILRNNPDYVANHKKANKDYSDSPEGKLKNKKATKKRMEDPTWYAKTLEGIKKSTQQEGYLERKTQTNIIHRQRSRPIVTPLGIFASLTDAGIAYNIKICDSKGSVVVQGRKIREQTKTNPTEFYHITKEEYIILTGKDLV